MDKATFTALTEDQKWKLIDSNAKINSAERHNGIIPCKPSCIGPLYTNTPMPDYQSQDGTTIKLDNDNIYNGYLRDEDSTDSVFMRWNGYTCQLYDGTLKMCPIPSEKSPILTGVCNGVGFMFMGSKHESGCWPAFLEMYEN